MRPCANREKAARTARKRGPYNLYPLRTQITRAVRSPGPPGAKSPRYARPGPPKRKEAPGRGRGPLETHAYLEKPFYFAACLRAERTAASMALLVTVAPATPSMSALWASSTCWA